VKRISRFAALLVMLTASIMCFAQETTGGLQGTVKDPTGALVPKAKVVLSGTSLVGTKELTTDSSGYYRFANLPPGTYTVTVTAPGFSTYKHENLLIEVGHLPTENATLGLGAATTTVEVSTAAPMIDTTSVENMTNVTSEVLADVPRGVSYQSVIEFAPMARNEPLAGQAGGTGGSMPGSSGNGLGFGYSIGGAADSENSYLVEGQDTEDISAGYSKANVPMEFIQEVQVKTSGISAEYGGALGGVINVIMRKGSNQFHGQLHASYQSSGTSANPQNALLRYDPTDPGSDVPGTLVADPGAQFYQQQAYHYRTVQPGVEVGGPILKDRVWFFAGLEPLIQSEAKSVNFNQTSNFYGEQYFTQDRATYFGTIRLDAALTSKIRVFGSWLTQYARETGDALPYGDPVGYESSYLNISTTDPITSFSHGLGFSAPNSTYNVGADISLTQHLVSTTRYGYFFQNYHDFGYQTTTPDILFETSGVGATDNTNTPIGCTLAANNCTGVALPSGLNTINAGTNSAPYTGTYTQYNASKHYQFDEDMAFYKASRWGTHNLKFGYELNHLSNVIDQNGNVPLAYVVLGRGNSYAADTTTGNGNCAKLEAEWTAGQGTNAPCAGQYGYITVQDFATVLPKNSPASDYNHALYIQDSWTVGKGVTLDVGLRVEKEDLPAPAGYNVPAIHFSWGDKVEPRLGGAWDPTRTGKMKIFGSYGVTNDVMKLLLAQTSFGAQAYEDCSYPLGPDGTAAGFSYSDLDLTFVNGRACPSATPTTGANFVAGKTPGDLVDPGTGVGLIENANFRPEEPVAPGVKPYRQHEYVAGYDLQLSRNLSFEGRYDRRRLDHILEDASLSDPTFGETYTVVNPGEGVNSTVNGYATFLTSLGMAFGVPGYAFNDTAAYGPGAAFGTCSGCPNNPKAVRNYDGLELRINKAMSNHWAAMASWTYSSLWGNYTGLTTTDQSDGGTAGRASPDTTRSFDEPFYYFGQNGQSNNGPLPTDRPNTFKGYAYYQLPWWKKQVTTFGLFQSIYEGSPVGSYIDLVHGEYGGEPYESVYVFGRGQWANASMNPTSGLVTLGSPYARRTPWYIQSDFSFQHQVKLSDLHAIGFQATASNVLNQHRITSYNETIDSWNFSTPLDPTNKVTGQPTTMADGASLYQTLETGYNVNSLVNSPNSPVIVNSQYGKPNLWQLPRTLRFAVDYTF